MNIKNKNKDDILLSGNWDTITTLADTDNAELLKCAKQTGDGIPCFDNHVMYYVFVADNRWMASADIQKANEYYNTVKDGIDV